MKNVVICEESKRPFRLVKQELEFYKKYNIPFPKLHPDIRFKNRVNKRAKFELYLKNCEKCNENTLTAWEKEKIICEKCYDEEIY
jgi:formylmethanofuran dehydrogenase subunit E